MVSAEGGKLFLGYCYTNVHEVPPEFSILIPLGSIYSTILYPNFSNSKKPRSSLAGNPSRQAAVLT
jgi:hypothetical protein